MIKTPNEPPSAPQLTACWREPRSATGNLTGTELIAESGLRRDVVYGGHKDLVQEFQARAKAQRSAPLALQNLTAERDMLAAELAAVRRELVQERSATAVLRRIAAELALEAHRARSELEQRGNVTPLPLPLPRTRAERT